MVMHTQVFTDDELTLLAAAAEWPSWPAHLPSQVDGAGAPSPAHGLRSLEARGFIDPDAHIHPELALLLDQVAGADRRLHIALFNADLQHLQDSPWTVFHLGRSCLIQQTGPRGLHRFESVSRSAVPELISAATDADDAGADHWLCVLWSDAEMIRAIGLRGEEGFSGRLSPEGLLTAESSCTASEARRMIDELLPAAPSSGQQLLDDLDGFSADPPSMRPWAHLAAVEAASDDAAPDAAPADLTGEDIELISLSDEQFEALWAAERIEIDPASTPQMQAALRSLLAGGLAEETEESIVLARECLLIRQAVTMAESGVTVNCRVSGENREWFTLTPAAVLEQRRSPAGVNTFAIRPLATALSELVAELVPQGAKGAEESWPRAEDADAEQLTTLLADTTDITAIALWGECHHRFALLHGGDRTLRVGADDEQVTVEPVSRVSLRRLLKEALVGGAD